MFKPTGSWPRRCTLCALCGCPAGQPPYPAPWAPQGKRASYCTPAGALPTGLQLTSASSCSRTQLPRRWGRSGPPEGSARPGGSIIPAHPCLPPTEGSTEYPPPLPQLRMPQTAGSWRGPKLSGPGAGQLLRGSHPVPPVPCPGQSGLDTRSSLLLRGDHAPHPTPWEMG